MGGSTLFTYHSCGNEKQQQECVYFGELFVLLRVKGDDLINRRMTISPKPLVHSRWFPGEDRRHVLATLSTRLASAELYLADEHHLQNSRHFVYFFKEKRSCGAHKTYLSGVWNHSKVLMATGVPAVRGSHWYIQTTFVCGAASPCPNEHLMS